VLRRFVPERVVSAAYRDPLALLGEPRALEVTALVTDLRDFTSYAEHRSPAEVFAFLDNIQSSLASIIHSHGGKVDKFLGDGILAVFGAPEPLADHAERALAAAAELLAAATDLGGVKLGIGVHTGTVVAGCLGDGARLEFTVVGDTVNVAARLESMTKELRVPILASEDTVRAAGGRIDTCAVGRVELRGRAGPVAVHTLRRYAP
jgi:class 3 adenylate cyclase